MNLAARVEAVWGCWMKIRLANPGRATGIRLEKRRRLPAIANVRLRCGALWGIASDECV